MYRKFLVIALALLLGSAYGAFPGTISSGDVTGPPGSVMVDSIVWSGLNSTHHVVAVVCSLAIADGNVAFFYNGEDYPHIMWSGQTRDWYDNLIPADPSRWMFATNTEVDTAFWDENDEPWGYPPVKAKVTAITFNSFSSTTTPLVIYFFLQMGWTDGTNTTVDIWVKAIDNTGTLLGTSHITKTINVQTPPPVSISGHVTTWNSAAIEDAVAYLEGGNIGYATDTTDNTGAYSFSGLEQGNDFTVYVEKQNESNQSAITPYDAYLIYHFLLGGGSLTDDQKRVANTQQSDNHFANSPYDVPGTGGGEDNLNPNDVRAVVSYLVSRPDHVADNYTGYWFFYPYWRDYNDISSDVTNADFTGYLMGDVDGNYSKKAPLNYSPLVKVDEFVPERSVSKVYVESKAHGFVIELRYNPEKVVIKSIRKTLSAPADLVYDYSVENGIIRIAGVTVNGTISGTLFEINYDAVSGDQAVLSKAGFDNTYYLPNEKPRITRLDATYRNGVVLLNSATPLYGSFALEIYTVDGRRIVSRDVNFTGNLASLSVGLTPGIYFIRVRGAEGISQAKLVVLR